MRLTDAQRIAFRQELAQASTAEREGDDAAAFAHLERAHILGQRNTFAHGLAHWRMLRHGWRRRDRREVLGQLLRLPAALTKTLIWVPRGNSGGADVPALHPMPVPPDLAHLVD